MVTLKFVTYNVRGLCDYKKRRNVFHHLHKKSYDVILLQETHWCKEVESRWITEWGGKIWFSHGESNARGVAIMFARDTPVQVHNVLRSHDGRYIVLYCTLYRPS